MNVAVIGASAKPDRYSYKAMKLLAKKGHIPFPIHPSIHDIDGITVYKTLLDVAESIDTITVYLSARNSNRIADDILNCGTKRVIFNPGAENSDLMSKLRDRGIGVVEGCTIVMLKTGQC